MANSQHERQQRLGEVSRGPVKSTNGTLEELVDKGVKAEDIYKALTEQKVDLVFTAHPTQALRRSMLKNFAVRAPFFLLLRPFSLLMRALYNRNRILC